MKEHSGSSRVTRGRSSENRQSGRSSSGRSSSGRRRSLSSVNEQTPNGRKRKNTDVNIDSTKRSNVIPDAVPVHPIQKRKLADGSDGDVFCWVCHKFTDEFYCPECPRAYHNKCIKKTKSPRQPFCECKWINVEGTKYEANVLVEDLENLFLLVFNKVVDYTNRRDLTSKKKAQMEENVYYKLFHDWPVHERNDYLSHIVSISFLVDKLHQTKYPSIGHFFQDVKWVHHNCVVLSNGDERDEWTSLALKFEKEIKQELSDMESCGECYRIKNDGRPGRDYFTQICPNNHPIVWAKLKGFPYWPAKCLRTLNGVADVRFFGTHDKSLVPLTHVYKISRRNPGGNPKKPKNSARMTSYEEAMTELSIYITKYENLHGRFQYSPEKTPLLPVKKPRKRGRQNKNDSQLNESVDSTVDLTMEADGNVDSSFDSSPPLLNVSLLHDDNVDSKAHVLHSAVPLENVASRSNEGLVLKMLFDAEGPSDMNVSEVEGPSTSHSLEACSSIASISVEESTHLPADRSSVTQPNISSDLPSTSSASTFLITSTHSLRTDSDTDSEPSTIIINNDSSPEVRQMFRTVMLNSESPESYTVDCGGEDEIEFISENPRNTPLLQSVMANPAMLKTFAELLLSNKPNVRNYIQGFQNIALQFYLAMWLDTNPGRIDESECKVFHTFCERMCREVDLILSQKRQLQNEVSELKAKLAAATTNSQTKSSLKNEILKLQVNQNIQQKIRNTTEINIIYTELDEVKNENNFLRNAAKENQKQIEMLCEELGVLKEKYSDSEKNLKDTRSQLEDKSGQLESMAAVLKNYSKEYEMEIEELKKNNAEKDRKIEELLLKLQREVSERERETDLKIRAQNDLAESKASYEEQIKEYKDEIKDSEDEIVRLKGVVIMQKTADPRLCHTDVVNISSVSNICTSFNMPSGNSDESSLEQNRPVLCLPNQPNMNIGMAMPVNLSANFAQVIPENIVHPQQMVPENFISHHQIPSGIVQSCEMKSQSSAEYKYQKTVKKGSGSKNIAECKRLFKETKSCSSKTTTKKRK